MKSYLYNNLAVSFVFFTIIILSTNGCRLDRTSSLLNTVTCPAFNETKLAYFPYEKGDTLVFVHADSMNIDKREFVITDDIVYGNTSYETVANNEVCDPYAEFLGEERNSYYTVLNYRIVDLVNSDPIKETKISVNISDNSIVSSYTKRLLIHLDGTLEGGENTEVVELGTKIVNGISYENVLELTLITPPDVTLDRFDNDVRSIWLSRNAGIIRFHDNERGTFILQP